MIKLKNGDSVEYNQDIDKFLQNLINSIIKTSLKTAAKNIKKGDKENVFDEYLLKEIMDNCIYVVHQTAELSKKDENISKLIFTGFLFKCVTQNLSSKGKDIVDCDKGDLTLH